MSDSGSEPTPPAVVDPLRLAGYRYVSALGLDERTVLHLYEQAAPRRFVAVRVWLSALKTQTAHTRFLSAAARMKKVSSHPYLASVYHADVTTDGHPFIVMAYYPRPHLGSRLEQGPLPLAEVVRLGVQVAGAVESAHRAGIFHGDIKPSNILMSQDGWPGLTGFPLPGSTRGPDGLAGVDTRWLAPELSEPDREGDARSDVYSLGAMLWHLLAGHSPFTIPGGDNRPAAVMQRSQHGPLPALARRDVPPSLQHVLQRALNRDPAGRFPTAYELAHALQAVQRHLRVQVTPVEVLEWGAAGVERAGSQPHVSRGRATSFLRSRVRPASRTAPAPVGKATTAKSVGTAKSEHAPVDRGAPPPGATATPQREAGRHLPPPGQAPTSDGSRSMNAAVDPQGRELIRSIPTWIDAPGYAALPGSGGQPTGSSHTGWSEHSGRSRRGVKIGVGAVGAAIVLLLVALWANRGRDRGEDRAAGTPVAQDVVAGSFVPPVEGKARRLDDGRVRFDWKASEQESGDTYLITRTDTGPGPRIRNVRQPKATYDVSTTSSGRPCLDIVLVRANGAMSDAASICLAR